MIRFVGVILAVLVNCMMGGTLAAVVGADPMVGAVGLNVVAATVGDVLPCRQPSCRCLYRGVDGRAGEVSAPGLGGHLA